ncbi:MAG: (2Fe-2S)-binding protein [Spirochaetales bacterium]|nr:(2Fe-2S)-binding protein [Spirochaetales bacterium]
MKRYRGDVRIGLRVNGEKRSVLVGAGETLLELLREHLGLMGAKQGCGNGDCGACTVLLEGRPVKSCLVPAVEADGATVLTAEGLQAEGLRQAFLEEGGFQCGFCTAGFLVNAHALLESHPDPSEEQMRLWLESNLCRCTGYEGIERAVRSAARAGSRNGEGLR